MKLPRPRFSVRWLMILVAVVAVAMPLVPRARKWADRRSKEFRRLSAIHEIEEIIGKVNAEPTRESYHKELAAKYEWASRYPWLPVWPDPPEPKD
jgi:hypothetical protein